MKTRNRDSEQEKAFYAEVDLMEKQRKQERNATLDTFRTSLVALKAEKQEKK